MPERRGATQLEIDGMIHHILGANRNHDFWKQRFVEIALRHVLQSIEWMNHLWPVDV